MRKHGRPRQPLTDLDIRKLRKPGRYGDARNGLYLAISKTGARSWLFIGTKHGKRHVKGLGSATTVSLKAARAEAAKLSEALDKNLPPEKAAAKRAREKAAAIAAKAGAVTFGQCAEELFASLFQSWRSKRHEKQWRLTLDKYCAPIWHLPVSHIGSAEMLEVLGPLWLTKTETALRSRGRIERVLDYAQAKGYRNGDNPARWRGKLQVLLPKLKAKRERVQHFAAMKYSDVPAFLVQLREKDIVPAKALEFIILTAARNREVLDARWPEIDFANALWTIPPTRMKAGVAHQVPLCKRALEILDGIKKYQTSDNAFIFPGYIEGRPLSDTQPLLTMRRLGFDFTTHGFRSSFRDWCGDCTHYPREVVEAALAHTIGDQTEASYRRGHALEKRRELMNAWCSYLAEKPANVTQMGARFPVRN
jgi:integrase